MDLFKTYFAADWHVWREGLVRGGIIVLVTNIELKAEIVIPVVRHRVSHDGELNASAGHTVHSLIK